MVAIKSRKDARALVAFIARYRSPTTFEYVEDECYDISVGGMFIKSGTPAPPGTLIKLECGEPDSNAKIRGVARVVWLRRKVDEHGPVGMGVKFVKLDPGARELINALIRRASQVDAPTVRASATPEPRFTEPPRARKSSVPAPAAVSGEPTAAWMMREPSQPLLPAHTEVVDRPSFEHGELEDAVRAEERTSIAIAAEVISSHTVTTADLPKLSDAPGATSKVWQIWAWIGAFAACFLAIVYSPWFESRQNADAPLRLGVEVNEPGPMRAAAAAAAARAASDQATALAPMPSAAMVVPPVPPSLPPPVVPTLPPSAAALPVQPPMAAAAVSAVVAVPVNDGQPQSKYVVDVVTNPSGGEVTIDGQVVVAPGQLRFTKLEPHFLAKATKDGFESTSVTVKLDSFTALAGLLTRRLYITLKPETGASAHRAKRVATTAAAQPAATTVTPTPVADGAAPSPLPPPAPDAADKPVDKPASKPVDRPQGTPLEIANACLAKGDNQCVVDALQGKAKNPRELELLIETLRAMGRSHDAQQQMTTYVARYPDEHRAAQYKRLLEAQSTAASTPAKPSSTTVAPEAPAAQ